MANYQAYWCENSCETWAGLGFVWSGLWFLSSVPQGTVHHLLFSLYTDDILTSIDSNIRLFADDCVCYCEVIKIQRILGNFKRIVYMGCWARKWVWEWEVSNQLSAIWCRCHGKGWKWHIFLMQWREQYLKMSLILKKMCNV